MEAFGLIRRDPTENYKALYSIYFDQLSTESGQLAIFKTALYKIARVKGLRLRQFEYSPASDIFKVNSKKSKKLAATKKPFETFFEEVVSVIDGQEFVLPAPLGKDGFNIELTIGGIDLSDVAEVRVKNLDYQLFDNGKQVLSVQSKRAVASYKRPEMILRGHVTIIAADRSKLESNHVKWDMKKKQFEVDGAYVLSRNGKKMFGKDTCVDRNLNVIGITQSRELEKEVQKCFAKL
jgi:hypothetical protein